MSWPLLVAASSCFSTTFPTNLCTHCVAQNLCQVVHWLESIWCLWLFALQIQWADIEVVLRQGEPLLHVRIWDVRVKTKINFFFCQKLTFHTFGCVKLNREVSKPTFYPIFCCCNVFEKPIWRKSFNRFLWWLRMLLLNISTSLLARQTTLTGVGWNLLDSRKLFLSSVSAAQTETFGVCWRRSIQPLIGSCRALFIPAGPARPPSRAAVLLYCVKRIVCIVKHSVCYVWTLSSNKVVGAI